MTKFIIKNLFAIGALLQMLGVSIAAYNYGFPTAISLALVSLGVSLTNLDTIKGFYEL